MSHSLTLNQMVQSKEHHSLSLLLQSIKSVKPRSEFDPSLLTKDLDKLGKSGIFDDNSYESLVDKIDLLELDIITLFKGEFSSTI